MRREERTWQLTPQEVDLAFIQRTINNTIKSNHIKTIIARGKKLRGQQHILFYGPPETGKSYMGKQVAHYYNDTLWNSITKPKLFGTIDKNMNEPIAPSSWTKRKQTIVIDEQDYNTKNQSQKDLLLAMCQIMEDQTAKRGIGRKLYRETKLTDETDESIYCFFDENGDITLKTRLSWIFHTMMDIHRRDNQDNEHSTIMQAIKSRCICIPWYPTIEQQLHYRRAWNFKIIPPNIAQDITITIPEEIIEEIENHVTHWCKENHITTIHRRVDDLLRLWAYEGWIDWNYANKLIRCG